MDIKMKYRRKMNNKHALRLRMLADNPKRFPHPAIRVGLNPETGERDYGCDNEDTVYIKRIYKNGRRTNRYRFYKHYSNKKIRRYPFKSWGRGKCFHRKIFDYWWTVD